MTEILKQLHQDHANFVRVLHALGHQVHLVECGQAPDHQILRAIIAYFRGYPMRFHHPKEDLLYNTYKDRASSETRTAYNLIAAHGTLEERIGRLENAVLSLEKNEADAVRIFHDEVAAFIKYERDHMIDEETHFFPQALACFKKEDWTYVDGPFLDDADPLFGKQVTEPFTRLYRLIVASDGHQKS